MIYKIVNPSDAVTIEANNHILACIAVTLIGGGWYGLKPKDGDIGCPMFALGGFEQWLKDNGITDSKSYIQQNRQELAKIFNSYVYGGFSDRELFMSAISKMDKDAANKFKAEWNDKRRSSLTNIGSTCEELAAKFSREG